MAVRVEGVTIKDDARYEEDNRQNIKYQHTMEGGSQGLRYLYYCIDFLRLFSLETGESFHHMELML